jgi:hypothetical protein
MRVASWSRLLFCILVSASAACQSAKAAETPLQICEKLKLHNAADACKPAELNANGVTRKEAVQFVVRFADEISYGGQVMTFNTPADLDAYKQAADTAQREVIKQNKLEQLADRNMPKHFENRERLLLVTLLPGPAVGKVPDKLGVIEKTISGK